MPSYGGSAKANTKTRERRQSSARREEDEPNFTQYGPDDDDFETPQISPELEVKNSDISNKYRKHATKAPSQSSSVKLVPIKGIRHKLLTAKESPESSEPDQVLITQVDDGDYEGDYEDEDYGRNGTKIVLGLEGESESDEESETDSIEKDKGYDTDLEVDIGEWLNPTEPYDPSGMKAYIKDCNTLGVIPVGYFQRHIEDRSFVMRNHGLGPLGAKALSKPLTNNAIIEQLDLQGNDISGEGAEHLCHMLTENIYISDLDLSENNLGSRGMEALTTMLSENTHIHTLDISGNGFSDNDCPAIQQMLEHNSTLRKLILRHNRFEGEGLKCFRDALLVNENLKHLDLSWNFIRMKGATYLAEIIKENYGLKSLNLQMNGLGNNGAIAIGKALQVNQCLNDLNIMNNRITATGAYEIARGVIVNEVLTILRMGYNSITEQGAMGILSAIEKNENSCITLLDLSNVIVHQEFEDLKDKINDDRSELKILTVIHGGVYYASKAQNHEYYDMEMEFENDPMTKLKRYAEKNKLRLVDLFKYFDRDNSWSVDREEFIQGVKVSHRRAVYDAPARKTILKKTTGIDMSEEDIDALIKRLDADGDGEIDYGELVHGDTQHRVHRREVITWKEEQEAIEQKRKEKLEASGGLILPDDPI